MVLIEFALGFMALHSVGLLANKLRLTEMNEAFKFLVVTKYCCCFLWEA